MFVRLLCQKNTNTSGKTSVTESRLGLKKVKFSAEDDEVAVYN